jgi:hypothetical protein
MQDPAAACTIMAMQLMPADDASTAAAAAAAAVTQERHMTR